MVRALNNSTLRVHRAILGYRPYRMKPVHFATSFILALKGQYYRLEYLNKASVPKTVLSGPRRASNEYSSYQLYPLLKEKGIINPNINIKMFNSLRAHLNAAFNNDGSALNAAFPPYSTFGTDFSTPSIQYISNQSKNHGHSGSFVLSVLEATPAGKRRLIV